MITIDDLSMSSRMQTQMSRNGNFAGFVGESLGEHIRRTDKPRWGANYRSLFEYLSHQIVIHTELDKNKRIRTLVSFLEENP